MQTWIAWITPLHSGVPQRHELSATSLEQAQAQAADLAACLCPLRSFAVSVWPR